MDFPYLNPVTETGKELYYPKGRRGFKGEHVVPLISNKAPP
jgi:hypothetical protein